MSREKLIPVEKVLNDIQNGNAADSYAAYQYYIEHYGDNDEYERILRNQENKNTRYITILIIIISIVMTYKLLN